MAQFIALNINGVKVFVDVNNSRLMQKYKKSFQATAELDYSGKVKVYDDIAVGYAVGNKDIKDSVASIFGVGLGDIDNGLNDKDTQED